MQITKSDVKGLNHSYTVKIPADKINELVENKIKELGSNTKIPGFRPGKAPMEMLRQRYEADAFSETLRNVVNQTVADIIKEKKIKSASTPSVDFPKKLEIGSDIEIKVDIEALPEIKDVDISKIKVEKLVAEADDKLVQESLDKLATDFGETKKIAKERKIKAGDIVFADLKVFDKKGHVLADRSYDDCLIAIESTYPYAHFVPKDVSDALIGKKPGEKVEHKVEVSKGVNFTYVVDIKEIREVVKAEINDELAKKLRFETLDELKSEIKKNLEQKLSNDSFWITKRDVLDQLEKLAKFDVPESIVEREFQQIWNAYLQEMAQKGEKPSKKDLEKEEKEYKEIAKRRVKLGLIIGDIAEKNKITIKQDDMNKALYNIAVQFAGDKKAFQDYVKNSGVVDQIKTDLLEKAVIEFILEKAKVTEKKVKVKDLEKKLQEVIGD